MSRRSDFNGPDIAGIGIGCLLMAGAGLYAIIWESNSIGDFFFGCAIFLGGAALAAPPILSGIIKMFRASTEKLPRGRRGPLLCLTDFVKQKPYDAAGLFLAVGVGVTAGYFLIMVAKSIGH